MADARFDEAKGLASTGRFQEALALLKAVVQERPQDAEARQLLADLQDRMMLDMQIREMLKKAQALMAAGQKEAAAKVAGDILKVEPDHPEARALLGLPVVPKGASPEATVAWDGFELEPTQPPPSAPEPAPPVPEPSPFGAEEAGGPLTGLESLDSLDAFDAPSESTVDKTTLAQPSSARLAPGEAQKVGEYLREGKALYAQGQYQDAVDVWTRVFILDESNQEAETLIAQAKGQIDALQGEIEHNLTEGIAAFNAGDLARAKPLLERVLQTFPGHREAQYYLSRISDVPPPAAEPPAPVLPPASSAQGQKQTAAGFGGSPDEFELEDNLNVPTGPEMRAGSSSPAAGFQWETETSAPVLGSAAASPPAGQAPALMEPGEFEAPTGFGAAAPPPPPPSHPAAPSSFAWDETPVAGAQAPLPPPPVVPQAAPRAAPRPAPKAARGGTPWGLVIAALVGLFVVGAGIFLGARWFFGGNEFAPVGAPTEVPRPKPPRPAPPQPPTPAPQSPQDRDPRTMSSEELLRDARDASAAKNFAGAVGLYQEALNREPTNQAALDGIASARAALAKQKAEQERNEKFIKDYQYASKSFADQDYAECLRVAWRLVYPDDTLARQLGKRDGVTRLIRDGYYNWAIMDLRQENVRGADKNLRDLLEFDSTDAEARRLQQFTRKYLAQNVDDGYRDTVKHLEYREFREGQ